MRSSSSVYGPIGLYVLVAMIFIPIYPHFVSPNEFSRWAAAAAVVEYGSFEVSPLLPLLGPGLEDLSESANGVFSNKAPGPLLLAIPAYAAARVFTGPPNPENLRLTLFVMRVVGASVPLVILALTFAWSAGKIGAAAARQREVVAALLFATPLFAYGLLFFSHALVAACLFGAWALLFLREQSFRTDLFAGFLLGWAVLSEYPAAIPAAVLIVCAIVQSWRRVVPIILGGAPFALALAGYNWLCFGSPLELSSAHERLEAFRSMNDPANVGLPLPGTFVSLLLDPSKGLLVFSPILILSLAGWKALSSVLPRRAVIALAATPLSLLLFYSGYPNWHGGWTVGVRYLVPALPFLLFPLAARKIARVEPLLAGWSVAAVMITTLVFPFVPPGFPMPWTSFASPLLGHGLVSPSLFHLFGSAAALAVSMGILIAAVLLQQSDRAGALLSVMGVVLAVSAGLLWTKVSPLSPVARIQRSYIEEVYFEREGAMQSEFPGAALPPSLVRRKEMEEQLPPVSWPF